MLKLKQPVSLTQQPTVSNVQSHFYFKVDLTSFQSEYMWRSSLRCLTSPIGESYPGNAWYDLVQQLYKYTHSVVWLWVLQEPDKYTHSAVRLWVFFFFKNGQNFFFFLETNPRSPDAKVLRSTTRPRMFLYVVKVA